MTQADADRLAELNEQESRFVVDSFDHEAGWRLGTLMVEGALRDKLPIIIDTRRPGVVLFRSALAGVTCGYCGPTTTPSSTIHTAGCRSACSW